MHCHRKVNSGDMNMMPKKEISRIPYPAKQRLSLWLQLHPIPEMQHQLPHLIATRMVLHFLWIIRPTLDGLHYAGRQWGIFHITNGSGSFQLPLSSTMLSAHIQHYGISAQYNGLSGTRVVSSLNADETLSFLAICK